jgi:hypothetical protein
MARCTRAETRAYRHTVSAATASRGWLNDAHDDLTQMTFRQSWTLDATGNWSESKRDTNRDGTWDRVKRYTCNPVNEIIQITTTTVPAWAAAQYDTTAAEKHDSHPETRPSQRKHSRPGMTVGTIEPTRQTRAASPH